MIRAFRSSLSSVGRAARLRRAARRRGYRRLHPWFARLDYFVNHADLAHESFTIALSYLLFISALWNEELLGLSSSTVSRVFEYAVAALLVTEITSRLTFSQVRGPGFYAVLAMDVVSLFSIVPNLRFAIIGRLMRATYAAIRLTNLLDRLARRTKNASFLLPLFPLVVPIMASLVYVFERGKPGTPIHNYFDALGICFSFALSLGNVRPVTTAAMVICGALFLMGIICIGIVINSISLRYAGPRQ